MEWSVTQNKVRNILNLYGVPHDFPVENTDNATLTFHVPEGRAKQILSSIKNNIASHVKVSLNPPDELVIVDNNLV